MEDRTTKRLLTVDEAASYLGMTKGSIYQHIHERTIPFVKVGRAVRFDLERIDCWIKEQSVEPFDYESSRRR
ncbi:MAG: excisionase family DNA-binding protein [Elusimicrobia bacterium]|nr:excisionase family DNA-binding protein [Elusimicrobiota bacterium]